MVVAARCGGQMLIFLSIWPEWLSGGICCLATPTPTPSLAFRGDRLPFRGDRFEKKHTF